MISTTGVAGLTLGGGLGWLMGKYGLSIDNLTAIEVVTADGAVRIVDDEHEPDLFWALRGGGGNFGVAASFEFVTHPLDTILGGIIAHPLAAAGDVIGMYREFATNLSDDATVFCGLTHAPDGSGMKLCAIALCHAGAIAEAEAELRPLREFGPPVMDLVAPMPYPAVNTMLDDGFPRGALNYWRSAFFTELSDAAVQALVDAYEAVPSPMTAIFIEHLPRRRVPRRPDGHRLPPPRTRLQPHTAPASGRIRPTRRPTCSGCGTPSPPSSRTRRRGRMMNYAAERRGRRDRRLLRPQPRPAARHQAPV